MAGGRESVDGIGNTIRPDNDEQAPRPMVGGSEKVPAMAADSITFPPPPLTSVDDCKPSAIRRMINMLPFRQQERRPWRASLIFLGPLSGLFGILLAMASLVASLGVLAGSNGQPVESWPAPPSTYLAILTAVGNLSIRYAAFQGVIIAWWSSALRGSTLSKLHQDWRSGTSFRGSITAGRSTTLLGLACIFSTLVVTDGPLLQRASTVSTIQDSGVVILDVSMAPEIPHGFTGIWNTATELGLPLNNTASQPLYVFNETYPTPDGPALNDIWTGNLPRTTNPIIQWWNMADLPGVISGCPGVCKTTIKAPALFVTSCTAYEAKVDPKFDWEIAATANDHSVPLETLGFFIAPGLLLQDTESIVLVTGNTTFDEDCTGTLAYRTCKLESAIGAYDITIQDDQIVMSTISAPSLVALANNTGVNHTYDNYWSGHFSTLGGIQDYVAIKWQSYVAYTPSTDNGVVIALEDNTEGPLLQQQFYAPDARLQCPSYVDPHDFMMNEINKLMFYVGAAAAQEDQEYLEANLDPGLSAQSTVPGRLAGTVTVFHTDYWFFLGAAIVEVVCIALVLPTYRGWWRIGRPTSFSPLEIAKAFRSPIMADANSNSNGNDLAAVLGERPIRYGVLEDGGRTELAFGSPDDVNRPRRGMVFDQ